ncbi:DUF4097 family beta strand repeat-containing protein [Dyadobacter sp. NIV53]|uniref:DUF4097 family beta strand repeat-containing protein n=1 Tax=Dyadobacter sp. NIV53 TaxID=2861765 RepID=UPI001C88B679|nr:DUF4097 family beta strand repeat-containing protein [Dyadobacter sp. NIV53]
MKTKSVKITVFSLLFFASTVSLMAQNSIKEQLTIPLSDPNKSGLLNVGLINGSIHVIGYSGKQIIVDVTMEGSSGKKEETDKDAAANGMRKLSSNGGLELTAEEDKNTVTLKTGLPRRPLTLTIKVPLQFSLKLSTINEGDILVENVSGELEISNVNGAIQLKDVSGSAVANTINGDLKSNFKTINSSSPMAFSTLNGSVDITFPATAKFDVKLKSDRGDVFSDFDIAVEKDKPKANTSGTNGMYKISIEDWVKGKVNGGGSEVMMKNMNGNIYVRKAK